MKDLGYQPTVTPKQWINLVQVTTKIGYATDTLLNNLIFHLHLILSLTALSSERVSYFVSLQNLLQRESSKGYAALHACCKHLQSDFEDKYPNIPSLDNISMLQNRDVDQVSQCLLPPDCTHLIPLKTIGDGNCLYR